MIEKLVLDDYKQFKGHNELSFDRNLTIIAGDNATGKSILFNALRSGLAGEEKGVSVETDSKQALKWAELVFVEEDTLIDFPKGISDNLKEIILKNREKIEEEVNKLLPAVVKYKPPLETLKSAKIQIGKDCSLEIIKDGRNIVPDLAAGEHAFLNFLYFLSVRASTGLDLPLVMDGPLARLDIPLREAMLETIKQANFQTIITSLEEHAEHLKAGKKYCLKLDFKTQKTRIA